MEQHPDSIGHKKMVFGEAQEEIGKVMAARNIGAGDPLTKLVMELNRLI